MTAARSNASDAPGLSAHDRRRIAVRAVCDPKCVNRYVAGGPLRATTIERIESALRVLGMESLIGARAASLETKR